MTLKIAVEAPMPRARVRTAMMAKPGTFAEISCGVAEILPDGEVHAKTPCACAPGYSVMLNANCR